MENVIDKLLRAQQELSGARKGYSPDSEEFKLISDAMDTITGVIALIE